MSTVEPKVILIAPLLSLDQYGELRQIVPDKALEYKRIGEENRARVSYPPAYHDKVAGKLKEWGIHWT